MSNNNPSIGPGNLLEFTIESNKGSKSADLRAGIAEYRYYESILSNNFSATATIVESGVSGDDFKSGVLDSLPIRGGERSVIKVADTRDNQITFSGDGLYVNRIRDASPDTQSDVYYLDFASKEYFNNQKSRVKKRYEGKISDNVRTILKDVLKTTDNIEIDETAETFNFYGNTRKPFYITTWLASKSVPTTEGDANASGVGGAAGFLFFQTRDGLYFKSIDSLLSKEPTKKFIYNNTEVLPEGYDDKIISYSIDSDNDMNQQQGVGAYHNQTIAFDFFSFNYTETDFNIKDQEPKVKTAGKDYVNVNEEFIDEPTRIFFHIRDIGSNPNGSGDEQLETWKSSESGNIRGVENFKHENALVQAPMRYNQLFTVETNITIPGDFTIKAGDIIECDFPAVDAENRSKDSNKQSGGKYLVAHLCHYLSPKETYTSLGLVRDSFGKKGGF